MQFEGPVRRIRKEPSHDAVVGAFKELYVVAVDDQAAGRKPVRLWIVDAINSGFVYVHAIHELRVWGLTDIRLYIIRVHT